MRARKSSGSARPRPSVPRQVRIIGGKWKRTPLPVPDAEGLRPTPDRVRETLFNWLNHLFDGDWERLRCLDLFAGTGALGFEAASRGAAQVAMIESVGAAARQLDETTLRLQAGAQVKVMRGDAFSIAARLRSAAGTATEGFDIVFLDPPYHQGWLEKMLPICKDLLSETGVVYAESEVALAGADAPAWMEEWDVIRADKAGMVFYHLLRRKRHKEFQA